MSSLFPKTHSCDDPLPSAAFLIVEHNMQILDLCERVVVVNLGKKICEGSPKEVREDEQVIRAYFGGEHAA